MFDQAAECSMGVFAAGQSVHAALSTSWRYQCGQHEHAMLQISPV